MVSISGLYLSSLVCMAWSRNLSHVKANSKICIVQCGLGTKGPISSYAAPWMYTMSGLSFVRHSHRVVVQMQESIHGGMVLCWGYRVGY